jgi:hypothetical protein
MSPHWQREIMLMVILLFPGLQKFKIWMTNVDDPDPAKGSLCNNYPGVVPNAQNVEVSCVKPVKGRYLFLKIMATGTLSLCEIKTWAYQFRSK